MKWEDRLERARAQREARLRSQTSSGVGESRVAPGRRPNSGIDAAREQRLGARGEPEKRVPTQRSQSLTLGQRLVFVGLAFCVGIGIGGGIILFQDRVLESETLVLANEPVAAAMRDAGAAIDEGEAELAATETMETEEIAAPAAESEASTPVTVALAPQAIEAPESETISTETAVLEPTLPETQDDASGLDTSAAEPVLEAPVSPSVELAEEEPQALEEPTGLADTDTAVPNELLPSFEELAERNAAANSEIELSLLGKVTDGALPEPESSVQTEDDTTAAVIGDSQPKIVDDIALLVPASLEVVDNAQLGTGSGSFEDAPRLAALSDGGPVSLIPAPSPGEAPVADLFSPKRVIAGAEGMSIRIFATGSVGEDTVETARATVEGYDLPLISVNRVNYRISQNQVRFYDNSSAEAAALLARELQAVARDFTNSPALSGTLEIYLAGDATAVTTPSARPAVSAPARRAAPSVDEATRLRNSVISRLRERMSQ